MPESYQTSDRKLGFTLESLTDPKPYPCFSFYQDSAALIYRLIIPAPRFVDRVNKIWFLTKASRWWKQNLKKIWHSNLPLKSRLFLWRCLLGVLPVGDFLEKRHIVAAKCHSCTCRKKTMMHLLWSCLETGNFLRQLPHSLQLRFPGYSFLDFFGFLAGGLLDWIMHVLF